MKKRRMQLILVGGLVLIGILLFVAARIGNDDGVKTQSLIISIKDSGYIPGDATVNKGTTVTWVNEGSKLHTVSSNPYKENTELPSLVSDPIKPQDTYSYTFNDAGTFKYHDELDPKINAQVVVQ